MRGRSNIVFWGLCFLALMFFLHACKTRHIAPRAPLKEDGEEYLFGKLKENEFKYEWLRFKFSANVKSDKRSNSFSGNVRIKRDSLIWISVSPMIGIEAARFLITNDSVKVINRLEATYFLGNFRVLNQMVDSDFDFDMLQAFLTGNDFSYYENDKFKSSVDHGEKMYKLSTVGRRKLKKYTTDTNTEPLIEDIWLDPETFKIRKLKVNRFTENKKFEALYNGFTEINGQLYPNNIEYNINAENKISISLSIKGVEYDQPMEFPFSIPGRYSQSEY